MTDHGALRAEAADLLQRLVAADTSNPPGNEALAAAVVEGAAAAAGLECERVAQDPQRPNLVVRLPGEGDGPSLAFLGHLDVVPARREEWSVEPFAALERDGAVWGRGTVDMKSQVAATVVALSSLAREEFRPRGDLLVLLMADEEVGEAGVGAPFFVEERPGLCPDFVVGEGAGERYETPSGPVYLLDCGVKASATATLTVRGVSGDASLHDAGHNAVLEAARLLTRLDEHSPRPRPLPQTRALDELDAGAAAGLRDIRDALGSSVFTPTVIEATGPTNVVPAEATVTIYCALVPGTSTEEAERELREALGDGLYDLELSEPHGGSMSDPESPLRTAIEGFLAEHDPEARLVPALGYGYSDCDLMRRGYGSCAYGFIPFRHADPLVNLSGKHGPDERVALDDLLFQTLAARHVAREIGSLSAASPPARDGRCPATSAARAAR